MAINDKIPVSSNKRRYKIEIGGKTSSIRSNVIKRNPMSKNDNQLRFEILPRPLDSKGRAMKWCSRCAEWVNRDGFHKNAATRDGLHGHCKTCRNEHRRMMYVPKKRLDAA